MLDQQLWSGIKEGFTGAHGYNAHFKHRSFILSDDECFLAIIKLSVCSECRGEKCDPQESLPWPLITALCP